MAENMGTYHLANNPDLYEVQRSNTFEFVVTGINDLLQAGAVVGDGRPLITGGQEVLRLSVVKAPIPTFKQEVLQIKRGNNVMKMAGVPTFDSGTIVVRDFIGADTKSVLMAWQKLSYDVKTEKVGKMSAYKKECTLNEYTPDWELVRYWVLKGCWVSGVNQDDFDMESGDTKTISATIEYDRAEMHLPDEE